MGDHIIDGEFQSDKYPTTPRGKVPLSVKDPTAQDLLWQYAQRRRSVDAGFADDLEQCLVAAGYLPIEPTYGEKRRTRAQIVAVIGENAADNYISFNPPNARAAQALDKERVRIEVSHVAYGEITKEYGLGPCSLPLSIRIADRVAEQLCSGAQEGG